MGVRGRAAIAPRVRRIPALRDAGFPSIDDADITIIRLHAVEPPF
jgi:hypothetical protein